MKKSTRTSTKVLRPYCTSETKQVREGSVLLVQGGYWPDCAVHFTFNKEKVVPLRIQKGTRQDSGVRPSGDGSFMIAFAIGRMGAGRLEIIATSTHVRAETASLRVEVLANPAIYHDAALKGFKPEKSFLRQEDFFRKRFGHLGFIPPGTRTVQLQGWHRLKEKQQSKQPVNTNSPNGVFPPAPPKPPGPGVCNWTPLGPATVWDPTNGSSAISGRMLCIAIDPSSPSTMFVGAASGGIWKSTDAGQSWTAKTDFNMSLAIGCLAIAPGNSKRIWAGTGEYHRPGVNANYYGNGLLHSEDGGETWKEITGGVWDHNEISNIVFDPTDPKKEHLFVSSDKGIYESDNGMTWKLLREDSASDVVVFIDPSNKTDLIIIGAFFGKGIWTSTRKAGQWSEWKQPDDAALAITFTGRIRLWQDAANPGDVTMHTFSLKDGLCLVRTKNSGGSWETISIRLNQVVENVETSIGDDPHTHFLSVPLADLLAAPIERTYTCTANAKPGDVPHTHTFTFTKKTMIVLASGGYVQVDSNPDAGGHEHTFFFMGTRQQDYNLVVAAHPQKKDTYYIGTVGLWRTENAVLFQPINSGKEIPLGMHGDHHAFAFDPVNPDVVWAGSDGGIFRSDNGGDNWEPRNRDLATLQYNHASSHPQWETVMLGGTQDNGGQLYAGQPVWKLVLNDDVAFTAIDPILPTRMYGSNVLNKFFRSDDAGKSFIHISGPIQQTGETVDIPLWTPPFKLAPSKPANCFFGSNRLWASPDHGDHWAPITESLLVPVDIKNHSGISALAVHPTIADTVYAGTSEGKVFLVQKKGTAWDISGFTSKEISVPGLPQGVSVSCLAVDSAGTVWATFASINYSEWKGEFTNDHVFCLPAGAKIWQNKNTGLLQANPVNTIVIDPANNKRLFAGCDLGVFITENAGDQWTLWDEGLPGAPVHHMDIFAPLRLLRAVTYGRGIWERPIDKVSCPPTDLYVRDNVLDSGRRNPSPEYVPHPFEPSVNVYHWECEDIKVDAPKNSTSGLQSPAVKNDYFFFESTLEHRNPKREATNRIYAQVHNRGVNKASNVKVRLFFADAYASLPQLPVNFWSGAMPFTGSPLGEAWTAVGETQQLSFVEPGKPGIVSWDWDIPESANEHSCLLMVTSSDQNPLNGAGVMDVDQLVLHNKQVGLKNLHIENLLAGMPMSIAPIINFSGKHSSLRPADLILEWGNLPEGTRVFFTFSMPDGKAALTFTEKKMQQLGLKFIYGPKKYFRPKLENRRGENIPFDFRNAFEVTVGRRRKLVLKGLRVSSKVLVYAQFNVIVPKNTKQDTARFSITQHEGKSVSGGSTYVLQIGKTARITKTAKRTTRKK